MKNFLFLFLVLTLFSCGKDPAKKSSETKQNVSALYSAERIVVKVYYEEGAEPYTEGSILKLKYWSIFQQNIKALFEGRGKSPIFTIPLILSEMTKIPSASKSKWSLDDVLNMAKTVATKDAAGTVTFSIFFVNGLAKESDSILGFHISNSNTMAIFKDVIKKSGTEGVQIYVEQATVVHEMGHALGLVNNGLPMRTSHQDSPHGAHCTKPDCVMYYQNEGTSGLKTFVQKFINDPGNVVMFGEECLEDSIHY